MNVRDPIRLGIVGCGRLAEVGYLPALRGLGEFEVVAVADPVAERREALAARLGKEGTGGVASYASTAALVARGHVEALVIASPVDSHRFDAEIAAAAAGLPCLIEKPPAPDLEGARAIAALDPAPWIGFNRRFQHGLPLLERLGPGSRSDGERNGGVGEPPIEPLSLELEIRYRRASWRPHTVDDAVLIDLAPHLIDLALLLTGGPEAEIRSAMVSPARVVLNLALGASSATIRCATDRAYFERVIARSLAGRRLAVSQTGGPARALLTRLPGTAHPLISSLRAQLIAFAAAVRGDDPGLLASAADGVRVMEVIESAGRSAHGLAEAMIARHGPASPVGRRQ